MSLKLILFRSVQSATPGFNNLEEVRNPCTKSGEQGFARAPYRPGGRVVRGQRALWRASRADSGGGSGGSGGSIHPAALRLGTINAPRGHKPGRGLADGVYGAPPCAVKGRRAAKRPSPRPSQCAQYCPRRRRPRASTLAAWHGRHIGERHPYDSARGAKDLRRAPRSLAAPCAVWVALLRGQRPGSGQAATTLSGLGRRNGLPTLVPALVPNHLQDATRPVSVGPRLVA